MYHHEIIVMSDTIEDEVDDASRAWEEQHPAHDHGSVPVHPTKCHPQSDVIPMHLPMPLAVFGAEEREDEWAWESAELHKLMEHARAKTREWEWAR